LYNYLEKLTESSDYFLKWVLSLRVNFSSMVTDLRTSIQKMAAKLFLKYGLRSVSIDDICNELRISKKTFYQFFPQKEALIESVLDEHERKIDQKRLEQLYTCSVEGNVIDRIMVIRKFNVARSNARFVNFFFDLAKYYPDIQRKHLQKNHALVAQRLGELIEQGVREGLFRTDFDRGMMTHFLSVQFISLMNMLQSEKVRSDNQKLFNFLIDVYIRLLSNSTGLAYYEELLKKMEAGETTSPEVKGATASMNESFTEDELERQVDWLMNASEDFMTKKELHRREKQRLNPAPDKMTTHNGEVK
jgi:AcrR family transcriptional regulator